MKRRQFGQATATPQPLLTDHDALEPSMCGNDLEAWQLQCNGACQAMWPTLAAQQLAAPQGARAANDQLQNRQKHGRRSCRSTTGCQLEHGFLRRSPCKKQLCTRTCSICLLWRYSIHARTLMRRTHPATTLWARTTARRLPTNLGTPVASAPGARLHQRQDPRQRQQQLQKQQSAAAPAQAAKRTPTSQSRLAAHKRQGFA